ncbi:MULTISPECIES: hypothetical protein [unclassified Moorena]|uniref:hypothetical protein n=1 Tax=unclassified Moorena TaxID=2683338 RepID=UPI0025DD3E3B|nr:MULTISPECIES: hypothetical protein [unclassified Moorena]
MADDSFTAASQFQATATAHPTINFPTPDSRFPTPDSRFPIPDSRFPIPDSRFPIPDSQFPKASDYHLLPPNYLSVARKL